MSLRVLRLQEDAQLPTSESISKILYSVGEVCLEMGDRAEIPTGISIKCPMGTYGRIVPLYELSYKYAIDVIAGIIHPNCVGEIKILLINHGSDPFYIKPGDKIAQIILERYMQCEITEVFPCNKIDYGHIMNEMHCC